MQSFERLENGLILRSVRDEADIVRFVDFNTKYNNRSEGATCNCLLRHHPGISHNNFLMIEDEKTGATVSTTCLIPWTCVYEGVPLKTAMLEMVLTHPDYRKLGLVRERVRRFHQVSAERGFDLCIIWGIPYYYRQYGYTYCIDINAEALQVRRIPEVKPDAVPTMKLRPAQTSDIPVLKAFYDEMVKNLQFHVERSPEYWEYLLGGARFPVWMVESDGRVVGYIILKKQEDGSRMQIMESGITDRDTAMTLLQLLKRENTGEILINGAETGILGKLVHSFGSKTIPGGQWLLRIPDMVGFLGKIGPVLERRLRESDSAGLSEEIIINLYRRAYVISFRHGKLEKVLDAGFRDASMGADGGHLCIPPEAFIRLLFGFRGLNDLKDAWPDMMVKPEVRLLLDVLFPRMRSYLYTPYHYQL